MFEKGKRQCFWFTSAMGRIPLYVGKIVKWYLGDFT